MTLDEIEAMVGQKIDQNIHDPDEAANAKLALGAAVNIARNIERMADALERIAEKKFQRVGNIEVLD